MKDFYIVISATSRNAADVFAEAYRLASAHDYPSVEVRECGTKKPVAHVFDDGHVVMVRPDASALPKIDARVPDNWTRVPDNWKPGDDDEEADRAFNEARRKAAKRETDRREARRLSKFY